MTKITNFPEALDTETNLPNIDAEDRMNDPNIQHDKQHTLLNQAVIEMQKKIGKNDSDDEDSLDFRVKNLEESGGGGGGSGLDIATDVIPVGDNPELDAIPERPFVWLVAIIDGTEYLVPGFKSAKIEPPENLTWEIAQFNKPSKLNSELVWSNSILRAATDLNVKTEWNYEEDGEEE